MVLDRVLADGVGWLAASDGIAVALLREAVDYLEDPRADPRVRPSAVLDAHRAVVGLLSELGFTPAARTRLRLAEVKTASKLEELEARRR